MSGASEWVARSARAIRQTATALAKVGHAPSRQVQLKAGQLMAEGIPEVGLARVFVAPGESESHRVTVFYTYDSQQGTLPVTGATCSCKAGRHETPCKALVAVLAQHVSDGHPLALREVGYPDPANL